MANKFFRSDAHKYAFALTTISGTDRCKLLGITEDLYYDENKATAWYNGIKEILENAKSGKQSVRISRGDADAALAKLAELYEDMMISDDDDDFED